MHQNSLSSLTNKNAAFFNSTFSHILWSKESKAATATVFWECINRILNIFVLLKARVFFSPYRALGNSIELWWSQLGFFFSPILYKVYMLRTTSFFSEIHSPRNTCLMMVFFRYSRDTVLPFVYASRETTKNQTKAFSTEISSMFDSYQRV